MKKFVLATAMVAAVSFGSVITAKLTAIDPKALKAIGDMIEA